MRFLCSLLVAAQLLLFMGDAYARDVLVYIMYGQGSFVTSPGMVLLSRQLAKVSKQLNVTRYNWNKYAYVVEAVKKSKLPVIVIGFSLGGNATTWVTNALPKRQFELVVAYDPSVWTTVMPAGPNVKRLLLYHNNGWDPLGHARIPGPQVETTETWMPHLAVDLDKALHKKTEQAVRRVMQ